MKKLMSLLFLVVFLSLGSVSAWVSSLNNDIQVYYTMNGTSAIDGQDWVNGQLNLTTFTNVLLPAGIVNLSYNYSAPNARVITAVDPIWTPMNYSVGTISVWANIPSGLGETDATIWGLFDNDGGGTTRCRLTADYRAANRKISLRWNVDGTNQWKLDTNGNILTGSEGRWIHIVIVHNGTEPRMYINGSLFATTFSISADRTYWIPNATDEGSASLQSFGTDVTGGFTTDTFEDGLTDEFGYWNRVLSDSEISTLYNNGVGTTYNPDLFFNVTLNNPTNATTTTNKSIEFNASLTATGSSLVNATLYIWNSLGSEVNTTTNVVTGTNNETVVTVGDLPIDALLWNVYGCTTAECSFAYNNNTLTVNAHTENAQNYTGTIFDTERDTFVLNITIDPAVYSLTSATLVYNGTEYTASSDVQGDDVIFTEFLDIPIVTGTTAETREFYWIMYLVETDGTINTINSTFGNQTVNPSNMSLCNYGEHAVNYTVRDEELNTLLNVSFDTTLSWKLNSSSSVTKNMSVSLDNIQNVSFCINANRTFYTDANIELSATGYENRLYVFNDEPYNTTYTNEGLYLLNSSDARTVIIEVKDEGLSPLAGYTVKIYRDQPGTGTRILVENDVTNSFGQTVAKLVENDVDYDFEFYNQDNELVKTVSNTNIACKATICVIPFVVEDTTASPFSTFDEFCDENDDLECSIVYTNTTNTFTFAWSDTSGESATFNFEVTRILANGTTIICDNSSTVAIGSLTCNVGSQKASYKAHGFRNGVLVGSLSQKVDPNAGIFGLEGLMWSFILLFTLLLVGLFNPAVAIGLYIFGFIFMGVAGIFYVSPVIIVAHVAIAALFWWAFRG